MEFNCREHFNWGANDSVATYERCMLKYDSGIAVRANVSARKIGVDKDGHAIRNYASYNSSHNSLSQVAKRLGTSTSEHKIQLLN
ncbi:hypothetical protein PVK06_034198 [Gossypium arboreum]|uniref:Uncharacterized protein n=1 Tax=Gossypium arboreum TaxID=29729 RepID=A0ABR0NDI3_GOSAR|nr:hypothetical protein PVK06_034198 [Gossypium arboreum]